MDEDVTPPIPLCSAPPPHCDPPAPVPPLSSSTPSSGNDGISGSRRGDRIEVLSGQTPEKQSHTDSAAQKPSVIKRERESDSMVRVSECKQPRVESTRAQETQNQDELNLNFGTDNPTDDDDPKSPLKEASICAAENVDERSAGDTAPDFEAPESDTDTCEGSPAAHDVDNASAQTSWVIGPLFQSFKSKMASFTEIVMSPVKLFKANSPPRSVDHPDNLDQREQQRAEMANGEHSEPSKILEGQSENVSEDGESDPLSSLTQARLSGSGGEQNLKTDAFKRSPKSEFNVDSPTRVSEQADVHDSVPLQRRPSPCGTPGRDAEPKAPPSLLLQPYVNVSASHECNAQTRTEMEDEEIKMTAECPQVKPLPRKRTANGSVLQRVSSKTFPSECDVNGRHVPDVNLAKRNIADSCNVKTQSLSSSVISYIHQEIVCFPDDDDKKVSNGFFVRKSLRNSSKPGGVKDPSLNSQKLEWELNSDTTTAAFVGKVKRRLQLGSGSQEPVKRKRLPADTEDAGDAEVLNVASDCGLFRARRPPRNEIVPKNPTVGSEIVLNPSGRRQGVSKRAKGKGGQQTLETANETASHAEAESSTGSLLGSSREKSSEISEENQSDSNAEKKTSSSCKRLQTKTSRHKPDVNVDNDTNLEASTKEAAEGGLLVVLHPVEVKPPASTTKTKTLNAKPLKRKLQKQANSAPELEDTLISTSSVVSVEPSGSTHGDLKPAQRARKARPRQPTKRQRKDCVGAVLSGPDDLHSAKESQAKEGKDKMSADPVYFEMTPFETVQEAAPSPSEVTGGVSAADDVFHRKAEVGNHSGDVIPALKDESRERSVVIGASELRSGAGRVKKKPRRVDKQRRNGRLFRPTNLIEEAKNSVTTDDADLSSAGPSWCGSSSSRLWRSLSRSYSCPEIPSLVHHDAHTCTPSLHSPQPGRVHAWHQSQAPHVTPVSHAHKSLRRARRHTVCSVEVAREIAPLCLRKEVYPSRRSTQHLSPRVAFSPSSSFSALASCFLSSPLAFLSKKFESRAGGAVTRGHASSPVAASSSASPSCSTWHLPRADAGATVAANSSGNPLEFVTEMRLQAEEEDDAEDTSSSSQEFEDVVLREEKALSDSEIKVVQKHQERGKVSSIRIRKTLPKPQNNLTPMGLPRPIRLKKKEFSLEEIYTNKNFNKPPESRLETIFEMPLSRRNGSESCFGQRRVRRLLEFPELGVARKPKRPLVGVGKAGTSRPRRGGYQNPKEPPSISAQDVDSLLCAKLEQLDLWLACDGNS